MKHKERRRGRLAEGKAGGREEGKTDEEYGKKKK